MASRMRRPGAKTAGRSADDPAIVDLLDTVRAVRTTLAIDLSAAAGALDEDQPEIAREILAATSAELTLISPPTVHKPVRDQLADRRRSRRTRALLALPAVPLVGAIAMTTAAAISGGGSTGHHVTASASQDAQPNSATTTLQRLEHVVAQHAKASQVLAVADDLHQQLTRMIVTSTDDPAQLHVVQQLLALEQHVLENSKLPGTRLALAASREVAKLLAQQPRHPQPKRSFSSHTTPTTAPTTQPTPSAPRAQQHPRQVPQSHPTSTTTHASPTPKPSNGLFGNGVLNGS